MTVQVKFKTTPAERALIRAMAGKRGISTYLRGLVRADAQARGVSSATVGVGYGVSVAVARALPTEYFIQNKQMQQF